MTNFGFSRDINPAISTLLDTAQRFSETASKKTKDNVKAHRLKAKGSKNTKTDSSNLSEEMMGDTDPDEYRGQDNIDEFKKKLKKWQEESKKRGRGEPDQFEDEEEEEEGKTDSGDVVEEDEKEEEIELSEEVGTAEVSTEITEKEIKEALSKEEKEEEEKKSTDPFARALDGVPSEVWENVCSKEEDLLKQEESEKEEETEAEGSFTEAEIESKHQLVVFDEPTSQYVSLLSYDDGFIIAEPAKKKKRRGKVSSKSDSSIDRQEKKPVEKMSASLKERYEKAFEKLIIGGRESKAYPLLREKLRAFGIKILEACVDNGERILIVPRGKTLDDFSDLFSNDYQEETGGIRWGYFPREKMVVLGEEVIEDGDPRFDVSVLYFAFAFDHAIGDSGFASENSPAVQANFKACQKREPGHQFADSFSSKSPIHYFAQAVESFLSAPRDQLVMDETKKSSLICAKEDLYDIDRSMYMYVEYLFKNFDQQKQT